MERYFATGLESSVPTVSEEKGMPTVQNLSEVQSKCGVRGENRTSSVGVNHEQEREPRTGRGRPQSVRSAYGMTPKRKSPQGGGERAVVDPTMISLVLRFLSPEFQG